MFTKAVAVAFWSFRYQVSYCGGGKMRRYWLLSLCLIFVVSCIPSPTIVPDATVTREVARPVGQPVSPSPGQISATSGFGFKLFQEILRQKGLGENLFVSPLSIWMALSATYHYDRQGYVGEIALFPAYVRPEGGTYVLAIQNSNDFMGGENPHGTACRLRVTWTLSRLTCCIHLPVILKGSP